MEPLTFKKFSRLNRRRSVRHFPCDNWTLADWGNATAGEVGEACNMVKKLRRGDVKDKDGSPIDHAAIGKELADIIQYVDLFANALGLDLEQILRQKFNEVSRRKKGCKIFFEINMTTINIILNEDGTLDSVLSNNEVELKVLQKGKDDTAIDAAESFYEPLEF